MKILVAEDEPMLLKTIELKLKKEGYEVIATGDGRDAIARIEKDNPDLVISDIMMPYASGLEVVSLVKQPGRKTIPLLFFQPWNRKK